MGVGVPAWLSQFGVGLNFSSGHDLEVCGFESCIGLHDGSAEPAWDSLSLTLCPSPALSLSLSKVKNIKKIKKF